MSLLLLDELHVGEDDDVPEVVVGDVRCSERHDESPEAEGIALIAGKH